MYMYLQSYTSVGCSFLIWSYNNLEFTSNEAFKTSDKCEVNLLKRFPVNIYHSVFNKVLQEPLCLGLSVEFFTASHPTKGGAEKKKLLAL